MGNTEVRPSEEASLPGEPLPLSNGAVDLTVVIPVYNEVAIVDRVLGSLHRQLGAMRLESEIIVVDDGSTDGTAESLRSAPPGAKVLHHSKNAGYGAALKTGIAAAAGKWICILDADGTYPIDRLPDLWAHCRPDTAMVVGARTAPGARIPLIRRPAKWLLRRFAAVLTGKPIPDLNSGFRIMKRAMVGRYLALLPDGFSFTSTITIAMLSEGLNVAYVPILYHVRSGKSKIRPIRNTYDFFMLVLRTSVFFAPLRFFTPLALACIGLSLVLVLYRAFIGEAFGVVSVLFFVTGLQLLALGLLADLVNRRLSA